MAATRGPVLLVEDNEGDVLLFRRALLKSGKSLRLEVVPDGLEAVRYLEGTGPYGDRARFPLPDLVVLDLKLPNKSGLEVLGWLRSTPTLNGLRVVVLTSSSEEADIDAAYGLGVESYLVKPVGFEELRVRVEALAAYWGDLEGGPAPLAPFATPPTDGLPGS